MAQFVRVVALLGIAGVMVSCSNSMHRAHDADHSHVHAADCGHLAIRHDGHVDYVHDGHLHHVHAGHIDDRTIPVTASNPQGCTAQLSDDHQHAQDCGHPKIPHGDHYDYVVDSKLHHSHGGHCDDHGTVEVVN